MKIAVLGYGTVGSGVVEVIEKNQDVINKRAGEPVEIKYILDIRDFDNDPHKSLFTKDFEQILNDKEVGVVAEAMGGVEPAYSFAKAVLSKGKSFATSNKELVALHGPELLEIAKENHVFFLFEASVGGGIPIIRPLNQCLTAEKVCEITGILNGTTNFILSKMKNEGRAFRDVLKEAQDLGYAEKDPTADVEGHDACRKIAILASLAYGDHVDFQEIPTEGITKISKEDFEYAIKMGYVIKLLGTCKKTDKGIFARVSPVMIPNTHPLAGVNDVFNGIFVKGNTVGDIMFYGSGAGKLPTASAVVSDIVEAVRMKAYPVYPTWNREKVELLEASTVPVQYFVRIKGVGNGAQGLVKDLFGVVEEIETLAKDEYVFVTPVLTEGSFKEKIEVLQQNMEVASQIRIEK